jgi:hypothetical protein
MALFFITDVNVGEARFQPTLPLGQINIFKNIESCQQTLQDFKENYAWRGFTTYKKKQ